MVSVDMTDEQFARIRFEQFLEQNNMSSRKNSDGTYYHRNIQNWWVVYQSGFRQGRLSVNATCEF